MAYEYGYGILEDQLIELFRSGAPDFEAAQKLLNQGADLNAAGKNDDENILSEILSGYWWSAHGDTIPDDDEQNENLNPELGPSMCQIIRFFLANGFDVNKQDGCYGAQCLWSLTLSTFDRYMIEATKLFLDAGAKNRTISPTSTDADETPWSFIGTEGSYQGTCEHNHGLSNIFEAVYQIYQAIEDGRPYRGIDSYEAAVGKTILRVFAESAGGKPIFYSLNLPEFKKDNCFNSTLYFIYDNGALISTQYADFWTDTVMPRTELVDVSENFPGVVGSAIERFTYDHRTIVKGTTHYGQPITTLEMSSGQKVKFSINFGEVENADRAAFFESAL